MAVIPQPNVPEPAMPWAREITKLIQELTGDTRRLTLGGVALNQQVGSTATAVTRVGVATELAQVTADSAQADALAPITNDRLLADSLDIWPFVAAAIPNGSFATGAVRSNDIADFALTAIKFNTNRHQIF